MSSAGHECPLDDSQPDSCINPPVFLGKMALSPGSVTCAAAVTGFQYKSEIRATWEIYDKHDSRPIYKRLKLVRIGER